MTSSPKNCLILRSDQKQKGQERQKILNNYVWRVTAGTSPTSALRTALERDMPVEAFVTSVKNSGKKKNRVRNEEGRKKSRVKRGKTGNEMKLKEGVPLLSGNWEQPKNLERKASCLIMTERWNKKERKNQSNFLSLSLIFLRVCPESNERNSGWDEKECADRFLLVERRRDFDLAEDESERKSSSGWTEMRVC